MFDWQLIRTIFFLFLPAMIGNSAPIFAQRARILPWLNIPVDLGISIRGNRLLGDNKTILGYVVGVSVGVITGLLLFFATHATPYDSMFSAIEYSAAISFGALAGDSVKSFFKRRVGIAPGKMWIPFDQIDFALGAMIAALFFIEISFVNFIFATIIIGCVSFISSIIGFALHIKKNL